VEPSVEPQDAVAENVESLAAYKVEAGGIEPPSESPEGGSSSDQASPNARNPGDDDPGSHQE